MRYVHLGVTYSFSDVCLRTFDEHRQRSCVSREIGGQLFARFTNAGISVDLVTVTRGKSKRTRFGFWPDRQAEREEIAQLFRGGYHYLGDWHTHPEARPSPSGPDQQKMLDIFRMSKHQLNAMLMVIVGQEDFPEGLYVGAVTAAGVESLYPQAAA